MARKKKNKGGRPPKKDADRKSVTFQIYVTPGDAELLGEAAELEGLPTTTWIRQQAIRAAREVVD